MPILSGKIYELRRRIEDEQSMVENIRSTLTAEYTKSLSTINNPELEKQLIITVKKHVKVSTKPFDANLKKLRRHTRHLNLKRQITHIFGSLIVSLFLIMIAHFTNPDFKYLGKNIVVDWWYKSSIISVILSVSFFLYALYRIWTLICIVVNHNSEQENSISNTNTVESE